MTDKQANRSVLAAAILGMSIIVAAAVSTGGPYRVVSVGTFPDTDAIRINAWSGSAWWCSGDESEWKELREQGETAEEIRDLIKRIKASNRTQP